MHRCRPKDFPGTNFISLGERSVLLGEGGRIDIRRVRASHFRWIARTSFVSTARKHRPYRHRRRRDRINWYFGLFVGSVLRPVPEAFGDSRRMSSEGAYPQPIDVSSGASNFSSDSPFLIICCSCRSLNVPTLMQRQQELETTVSTLKEQIDRLKRDVSSLLDVTSPGILYFISVCYFRFKTMLFFRLFHFSRHNRR